tara:strand:- start:597 stop:857 length:261 start_codon:yes stop_codon:yes gene_type:complete
MTNTNKTKNIGLVEPISFFFKKSDAIRKGTTKRIAENLMDTAKARATLYQKRVTLLLPEVPIFKPREQTIMPTPINIPFGDIISKK